jgi:tetratricopeptide (TPR) repeat protein
VERGARKTAVLFAQAAALAWPRHARYAWLAARILRSCGRVREAEVWLRRAHRVAVWTKDSEAQARALNSLGNLHLAAGRPSLAKRLNLRALKIGRRKALRALEGEVSHDLFVIHAGAGERERAEAFASAAFSVYSPSHPRLLMLVHDIARFWMEQGLYWRALPIFQALLRRSDLLDGGIRELAGTCRAAGGASDSLLFESCAEGVWERSMTVPAGLAAAALYDVGLGAESLAEHRLAETAFRKALELASKAADGEVVALSETAISRLCSTEYTLERRGGRRELDQRHPGDRLAWEMAQSLAFGAVAV